jgi:hypothetical protein
MAERQTRRRLYAQNCALTYVAEMQRSASKPMRLSGISRQYCRIHPTKLVAAPLARLNR